MSEQAAVEVAPQQPMQESAKSSYASVSLPSGYIDDEGEVHKEAYLKEMTGVEEDLLATRKMPIRARLSKIIENCTMQIGPYKNSITKWPNVIKSLTIGDQLFLLLHIRIQSLGPIFSAKCICPFCENKSMQNVDLNDFVFGAVKDNKRTYEGVLPRSGKKFLAKVMTGYDEEKVAKYKDKDPISLVTTARLLELDGKKPVNLEMVRSLGIADRQYLRKQFTEHEGDLDNSIEYTCSACSEEAKHEVSIASVGFFFPSDR